MSVLRGDLLSWLATILLGVSAVLAIRALLKEDLDRTPAERARPARWCAGAGGYLLLLSLAARGLQTRGWPFTSTYEAILLAAAAAALVYALGMPRRLAAVGGVCAGLITTPLVALAMLVIPTAARVPQPPLPALTGIWFPLHILSTALGYGGFLLAGCAALLRFVRGRVEGHSALATSLEALAWYGLRWGYLGLTLGMITGAVWGWLSWGRYWSWTVKEVLTLLTWGLFSAAFHTRRLRGWRGRPHAAIMIVGLVALLLTLLAAGVLSRQVSPTMLYIF